MSNQILISHPSHTGKKVDREVSLLKQLRERKKISRTQLSKMTQLSAYQVEGLEGKGAGDLLSKFFSCTSALGYEPGDIMGMMGLVYKGNEPAFLRGSLNKPLFETTFQDGVRLITFLNANDNVLSMLELAPGKDGGIEHLPAGDIVFGIVREGTLVIDLLLKETVYKKDSFFILPGVFPVKFLNTDRYVPASVLIFSIKYPK